MRTIKLSDRKIVQYSIDDLREKLGISKPAALKYVQAGIIPAAKIGRRWWINEEDLEAFLTRRRPSVWLKDGGKPTLNENENE